MSLQDRQVLQDPEQGPPSGPQGRPPDGPLQRAMASRVPYVSYAVIGLSALMYFAGDQLIGGAVLTVPGIAGGSANVQPWILYGPWVRAGQWWRVFGYLFEHDHRNLLHIFFNMSAVWSLGTVLERIVGNWRFLLVSVITALGSSALVMAVNFHQPTVGASGMIIGWAGAFLPILPRESRQRMLVQLLPVAVISLLPGVSWAGHLGGFIAGIACGFALRFGPQRFSLIAPVLIFLSAVAVVLATFGGHS